MTVKELIKKLSQYPEDTKIDNINLVTKSSVNSVSLYYKESPKEIKNRQRCIEEANRRHQEEFDKRGEITSFANRW